MRTVGTIPILIAVGVGWAVWWWQERRRRLEAEFDVWWEQRCEDAAWDCLYVDILEEMWVRPCFVDQDDAERRPG